MKFSEKLHAKYQVTAVHWSDLYPKGFHDFRKKYLKIAKTTEGLSLYVQFSNYADNTIQKAAHPDPNHSDPVGIYGYPLKYVLQHPADVWYGAGAKYLRVLRDTSKNKLWLAHLDRHQTSSILYKMGFKDPDALLDRAWKHYKDRIGNVKTKDAKTFMTAVQLDLEAEPKKEEGSRFVQYPVRSGAEQTKLFRRAGFDALLDTATKNTWGSINEREPEQIVFLTRGAFQVEEVFSLRSHEDPNRIGMTTQDPQKSERKLASSIAATLDDVLKEGPERANMMGWSLYWTAKGRRIEIEFPRPRGEKFGEKRHREDKLSTSHRTNVRLHTEYGDREMPFAADAKFSDVLKHISDAWANMKAEGPSHTWEPETKKTFMEKREAAQSATLMERLRRERDQEMADVGHWSEQIAEAAATVGVPWDQHGEASKLYKVMKFTERFYRIHDNSYRTSDPVPMTLQEVEALLDRAQGVVQHMKPEFGGWTDEDAPEPHLTQMKNLLRKAFTTIDDPDALRRSPYWITYREGKK